VNFPLANDYVISIEEFSRVAPRHPQTPDLLLKAAEMARGIKTYQKAIELFDRLISNYPGHPKGPQALFMKAFTLDDGLQDIEAARSAYMLFLEKYPNDDFADDARFSLDNLGKDINELIDQFETEAIDQ
jgi:TolA-binding protein